MYKKSIPPILALTLLISGCGAYFNQPYAPQDARTGELAPKTETLRQLPLPTEPVVVGVYNFKDQTGQYKAQENGSSFSTAVSQGATTMLIQALEESKWFTPIERENLNNLLNERNIIRSTREEFRKNESAAQPMLPPLLYAGVLLEGGIVSYDTNIITGGAGARYFGAGASVKYRQDRISIYLRAVSTSNGKILKTVYVSKTILSQAVDASLFRYVSFQRLMEAETGFTKNEPVQLAMKDAIEKAVESLIIEGVEAGLWSTKDGETEGESLVDIYRAPEGRRGIPLVIRSGTDTAQTEEFHLVRGQCTNSERRSGQEKGGFRRISGLFQIFYGQSEPESQRRIPELQERGFLFGEIYVLPIRF